MSDRHIFFFGDGASEGDPDRKDILGGKGAALAAMSRADLPVPPGFTISTLCCKAFSEAGGQWPAGLEDDVRTTLRRLEAASGRTLGDASRPLLVSVRSGAERSMPGMMDTLLNCGLAADMIDAAPDPAAYWRVYRQFILMFARTVAGIDAEAFSALPDRPDSAASCASLASRYHEVYAQQADRPFPGTAWDSLLACIEAVFNSWQNERAITYRREHNVRGLHGTAVNVQLMFPSEVSGIVFTVNPNRLDANEMVIESSYGLGESVVSGDVQPDMFQVDRDDLDIKACTVGKKASVITALGDTAARDPEARSLTDQQVRELAEMALRVEAFFGGPQDLEWGLADGRFALLQSRAIRGLDVAADVEEGRREEIERLKALAGERRRVWVRHNLDEILRAPTPLTWDIVRRFMSGDGGFGGMYRDLGYRPSREVCDDGFLELICGRIYADPERAADLFWAGMPLTYDVDEVARDPKVMDAAPGKFDPERADGRFLVSLPRLVRDMIRCSRRMKQAARTVVEHFEGEVVPSFLEWVKDKRVQDLSALTTDALLEELSERIAKGLNAIGRESLKPGFFGGVADAALATRLEQLMGEEAGRQLALRLTQGLEGDSTVRQNTDMYRLAHGELTLEKFIEMYGHRGVGEMELSRPRWHEDDAYIRQVLEAYRAPGARSPGETHDANVARRREAESRLPDTLREWGGSSFQEEITADMRDARKMLPYRETGKDYLMKGYDLVRRAIVALGERFDLGSDIFFLTLEEVPRYEADREPLAATIAARKIRWQSARQLDMPMVVDTEHLEQLGQPVEFEEADELTGEPVASGVATGPAMIVFDPHEVASVQTDYVLVCPSTDPGWTALFVHAVGLVVEQGGVLSHGAIVARDFGIPAVVCPDATRRIADGAQVRVDGNRGVVTIVEGAEPE